MQASPLAALLSEVDALRDTVENDAATILGRWNGWIGQPEFEPSAQNFARYLALRQNDIRPLQRRLMRFGLSSLGRVEGRVAPALGSLGNALRSMTGAGFAEIPEDEFFAGERRIAARAETLFGPRSFSRPVSMMVTLPSGAADDPEFTERLADLGVEAVRINCAHDDEAAWGRMIAHVRRAGERTGRRMKVLMDLAGPKIRTGALREKKGLRRVTVGDDLAIALPGRLGDVPGDLAAVECTLPQALAATQVGHRIFVDDGKLATKVTDRKDWGAIVRVQTAPEEKGYRLKAEKGINFPDTDFEIAALTDDDREALRFVAHHADGIEFSFVQGPEDVAQLQEVIAQERPGDWRDLGLVLKIETLRAVRNLPDMLVRAAGHQPTAIMIARGDLAVEIGFARLAEMQEEILWLCEAAQVPVIWATQVLESYLKTGVPSRGEMTDAAMGARAECVMLNKGPHLFEAIAELDHLLGRMSEHMSKKTPQLRVLHSWPA